MTRVVSFLPAGTEIAYAIGAGELLVGRSHECDYPVEAKDLPVVSRPALDLDGMSQSEVDHAVASQLKSGESLYRVDEALLQELAPDVVLTQDLCQVCAPSGNELSRALQDLPKQPEVVWLTPQTISDIEKNIRDVGRATRRQEVASWLVSDMRKRLSAVRDAVAEATRRRVVFLEWTDPLFCAGHWVPEMIHIAGGDDPLAKLGADSERITWEQVLEAKPEMIVVAPCGYGLERAVELAEAVPRVPEAMTFAVDANAYFARPGPRVAEGVELLAHLFHPQRCEWTGPGQPWKQIG